MSEEKIQKLVDELGSLTVLDMSKLKKALEEAWDVKAAAGAPMMMAAAPAAGGDAAADEATDFAVSIDEFPADKKISVIKVIREITGLGLKEAKEMAESCPKVVEASAPKAKAEELQKKLQDAGAKVSLKPA